MRRERRIPFCFFQDGLFANFALYDFTDVPEMGHLPFGFPLLLLGVYSTYTVCALQSAHSTCTFQPPSWLMIPGPRQMGQSPSSMRLSRSMLFLLDEVLPEKTLLLYYSLSRLSSKYQHFPLFRIRFYIIFTPCRSGFTPKTFQIGRAHV